MGDDVVRPEPDDSQFDPRIEGDYLWGRGAADMKTVVASYIVWMRRMAASGPPYPPFNLLLVGNEENGEADPFGTPHVLETLEKESGWRPGLMVVGERTGEVGEELYGSICTESRGVLRMEITARGGHNRTNGHVVCVARKEECLLAVNSDTHAPSDLMGMAERMQVALGAVHLSHGEVGVGRLDLPRHAQLVVVGERQDEPDDPRRLGVEDLVEAAADLAGAGAALGQHGVAAGGADQDPPGRFVADLLAAAGTDIALVIHLGEVYGFRLSRREASKLLLTISAQLVALMGAYWGVNLVASALKTASAGLSTALTATSQGALAWYATYLTGQMAQSWFSKGKSWGNAGPKQTARNILASLDRDRLLRTAREDVARRIKGL